MGFLETLKKSIYNPTFYRQLLTQKFSTSLKYFITLILALAVILCVPLTAQFLPLTQKFFNEVTGQLAQAMPANLTITLKDGQVSVNQPLPVVIAMPVAAATSSAASAGAAAAKTIATTSSAGTTAAGSPTAVASSSSNILAIDTTIQPSLAAFQKYHTTILVTKNEVSILSSGAITSESLAQVPNQTITKVSVTNFSSKFAGLSGWLAPIIVFGSFFLSLLFLALTFIYLIPGALLVWLVARLRKVKIGYGKSYQLSLHAVSLSLLVYVAGVIFGEGLGSLVPVSMILLVLIVIWFNLGPVKTTPPGAPSSPSNPTTSSTPSSATPSPFGEASDTTRPPKTPLV